VLGSTLAAVFPRILNVGFRSIPGKPSRSSPKHTISGRKSDSLKGMVLQPQLDGRAFFHGIPVANDFSESAEF
jgi:hypothetical protein